MSQNPLVGLHIGISGSHYQPCISPITRYGKGVRRERLSVLREPLFWPVLVNLLCNKRRKCPTASKRSIHSPLLPRGRRAVRAVWAGTFRCTVDISISPEYLAFCLHICNSTGRFSIIDRSVLYYGSWLSSSGG